MRTFYFVGGPSEGHAEEFFRRLGDVGGAPHGWTIHPHLHDNRALHIVTTGTPQDILDHLAHFDGIYERGEIVELRGR